MHRRAHRAFGNAQIGGGLGIRDCALADREKRLQQLEQPVIAFRRALGAQSFDHACQQGQRPFAVEGLVRTRLGRWRRFEIACPPSASRATDASRRRRVSGAATCPIRWRENVSATPAGTRETVRARRSSLPDNSSPEIARRKPASGPRRPPSSGRAAGRRRRAETSKCGKAPPARDPIAAWTFARREHDRPMRRGEDIAGRV